MRHDHLRGNASERAAYAPTARSSATCKVMMGQAEVAVRQLNISTDVFQRTVEKLNADIVQKSGGRVNSLTGYDQFLQIYGTTSELYRSEFPDLWHQYVPLYNTVWRQDLRVATKEDNIHQDEGVYEFGIGGYKSRMINLWICLEKDLPATLGPEELGIFVVEPGVPENDAVYSKLVAANTHFASKRAGQLVDNTHVGGPVVQFDAKKVMRRSFPFLAGTAIAFSSHLLHGTHRAKQTPGTDEKGFRTALASVWVHRSDFARELLELPAHSYGDVYFKGHDSVMRDALRKHFSAQCTAHERGLSEISALARHHLARS